MKKRSVIAITALAAMSFQVLATTPFGVTSRDISGEKRLAQQQVFSTAGVEKSARRYEKFCRYGI